MAKLTQAQVSAKIAEQLGAIITAGSFTPTANDITGLVEKIGKSVTITGNYNDPLDDMSYDASEYGIIIEEWFLNLIMPVAYDRNGTNTLAPHRVTKQPNSYSYPIEPLNFPVTIDRVGLKRGFNSASDFADWFTMQMKRLYDSIAIWHFNQKKELLGRFAKKAVDAVGNATSFSTSGVTAQNYYKDDADRVAIATATKSSGLTTFDAAVADGTLVIVDLVKTLDLPVDTATGEAFIEQLKLDVKNAKFASSEHNLNGSFQGVSDSMKLFILPSVSANFEVNTLAGAFNRSDVDFPVKVQELDSFGSNQGDIFAILVDTRGVKLAKNEVVVDSNVNAEGHFENMFYYEQATPFYSPNTYIRVYKKA